MMDKGKIETLRRHIFEMIKGLKADIVAYNQITKPVSPDSAIGRLTRLEAMNSKSINEAALRMSENRLERLERAMTALYEPDFGYCAACEEPIPFARLMIMPEAEFCVCCAEKRNA